MSKVVDVSTHSSSEDDILSKLSALVRARNIANDEVHIGDDAAVLAPFTGQAVISTDTAVWGIHLDQSVFGLSDLGYKAVTSAVSDIAAMGAMVRGCVIGVTSPAGTDLEELYRGVSEASREMGCPVVGGDLSSGHDVSLTVTVFGECPGKGAVLRSGAQPGDTILVTGPLGRAAAGLREARAGANLDDPLVLAHRRPVALLSEGLAARGAGAHAMMDLSDGLALDLHRLADASNVGFELESVPVGIGATEEEALSGGEDYELLITTDEPERMIMIFLDRGLDAPIEIGRVVADVRVRTLQNEVLEKRGFQHRL